MMSAMTDSEPMMAERVKAISPMMPILLKATPPRVPDSRTTKATPMLAPELMPSTEGPASGLRNTVCIWSPLTDSPAPATRAVSACGIRDFQMMLYQISLPCEFPHKICHTSLNGIDTDPRSRFKRKKTKISRVINTI